MSCLAFFLFFSSFFLNQTAVIWSNSNTTSEHVQYISRFRLFSKRISDKQNKLKRKQVFQQKLNYCVCGCESANSIFSDITVKTQLRADGKKQSWEELSNKPVECVLVYLTGLFKPRPIQKWKRNKQHDFFFHTYLCF